MAFPDIHTFKKSHVGPYECRMGEVIVRLLKVFADKIPDAESHKYVSELVATPTRWSAGHAVFDEVRSRLLVATKAKDELKEWQYYFEESCCQAVYNATDPPDPFDPSSAFFVASQALGLARAIDVSIAEVVEALIGS